MDSTYCDFCVFYGAGTSPCRLCGGWIEIEEDDGSSPSESDDEAMASI